MNPESDKAAKLKRMTNVVVLFFCLCQVALFIFLFIDMRDRNTAEDAQLDRRLQSADALVNEAKALSIKFESKNVELSEALEARAAALDVREADIDAREEDLRKREANHVNP